jgi:adenylate kinase family enzyme
MLRVRNDVLKRDLGDIQHHGYMNRVLILGCPGAGKSTLAQRLAQASGLNLFHLDQLYWQPGWIKPNKEEWRDRLTQLLGLEEWIIDGNYGNTLPLRLASADTAIFLDFPRWICLSRALRRVIRWRGRTRADMPYGCPERFDWDFLRYIWTFHATQRPQILRELESFAGRVLILRTPDAAEEFIRQLRADYSGFDSALYRNEEAKDHLS